MSRISFLVPLLFLVSLGCQSRSVEPFGTIERLDPALDALIAKDAQMEKLASGFKWTEGPVWDSKGKRLLFCDIPNNVIEQWTQHDRISEFLKPSGYTGAEPRSGEPGSNGLTFDSRHRLVLCQHGDRRIARLNEDGRTFTTLVDNYEGKKFNSPNDLCYDRAGNLYFTDPGYGLAKPENREINFNGVYRLSSEGKLTLLTKDVTFPNGVALSPDEKTLYIAVSDEKAPLIYAFDLKPDGTIANRRTFFDAGPLAKQKRPGNPDGVKVDNKGNLFATGPGGVLILSRDGKHLGTLMTGQPTANVAFGGDGSWLYITSNHDLLRIKLKTRGPIP